MLRDVLDRKINGPVQSEPRLEPVTIFFLSFLFLENILILLSNKFNYVFDRALLM